MQFNLTVFSCGREVCVRLIVNKSVVFILIMKEPVSQHSTVVHSYIFIYCKYPEILIVLNNSGAL